MGVNSPFFVTYSPLCHWFLRRPAARRVRVPWQLWVVAGCVVSLALSAGVAQEGYHQPDYGKFPVDSGPVTLEVWSWVDGLDKDVKLFEQAYPNIKVHVDNVGDGPAEYQKLQAVIKAGSGAPDVAQIEYVFLPSFIVTDGLADLSKYGANDLKSFFVPWTWGQVSPDGKAIYAIPQDTGPIALLYNKKIFDRYGLTVPATWDEFAQQAEKLAQASSGKVKMLNFSPTHAQWFISMAWASGSKLFKTQGDAWVQTLNDSACERVLTYWDGLIKKQLVSTIPGFTVEFYNAIGSGQIASSIEAAWGPGLLAALPYNTRAGEWRVAPLPQWSKDQPLKGGNWGGSCNVVPKQSKHLKEAVLFSVWLNTAKEPVLSNWSSYGIGYPASLAGLASPEMNQPDKEPSKFCGGQDVAEVYLQASKAVDPDFAWAPWFGFVNDNYNKQIESLLRGKATPKQALDAWQNESLKDAKSNEYKVKTK